MSIFRSQRENQQKLREIGKELSNVDASANRLRSLEGELQRAVSSRVVECDVFILQIFTFKLQDHIIQRTQQPQERVQNFKSLAQVKIKRESHIKFHIVPY